MSIPKKKNKGPILDMATCRCCRATKRCRILTAEYTWMEEREMYANMIIDCFGVLLSNLDGDVKDLGVCASCVDKLREACAFRQLVLQSETLFSNSKLEGAGESNRGHKTADDSMTEPNDTDEYYSKAAVIIAQSLNNIEGPKMKEELKETSPSPEDGDDSDSYESEEPLMITFNIKRKMVESGCQENEDAAKKPKIKNTTSPELHMRKKLARDCVYRKPLNKKLLSEERKAQIHNIFTLLRYSNASPFRRRLQSGYPCFFCLHPCANLKNLRQHQAKHKQSDIVKKLNSMTLGRLLVYVDITDLKCTICSTRFHRLDELRVHMTQEHEKTFHAVPNRIVPFKISREDWFECQLCDRNFGSFKLIESHMNAHSMDNVCKECGAVFLTRCRLNRHFRMVHKS